MKEVTAQLNMYRQSPRKVRLVADSIRGKKISDARNILDFTIKRATSPLHKLLNSAVANAKDLGVEEASLFVKKISVDGGKILYRSLPAARGSAHPMRKRTSNIKIVLGEKQDKPKKTKK